MFEIVFLGTSASAPSIHRGLSAAAVLAGEERFLVDCGEGTQRQILRSGIGFKRLNHILITHQHLDHILGLAGLVSTFVRWEALDALHIYGSAPTLERVHKLLFDIVLYGEPPTPVYLHEVQPGEFYRAKHFSISAFPVRHRGPGCLGYIFQQDTHHPFQAEKAEALGVPAGPERAQLVRGESITLADGSVITPDMVLGDPVPGVRLIFTGDTASTDYLHEVVRDADVLVTEATFLAEDDVIAADFGHITAQQAAELAQAANVRDLLLTHIGRRYAERDVIDEARKVHPHSYVARDLDHFVTKRGDHVERQRN